MLRFPIYERIAAGSREAVGADFWRGSEAATVPSAEATPHIAGPVTDPLPA